MDKLDIMRTIKERGLMAKDIAHKMGITHIAMSQRINGNPRLDTLRNLAEAIGCNIGDFFYPIEEGMPKEGLFAQKQQTPKYQQNFPTRSPPSTPPPSALIVAQKFESALYSCPKNKNPQKHKPTKVLTY